MFDVLDSLKPHAHWLLRIGLASVFIFHGIGKAMALGGFAQMMGPHPSRCTRDSCRASGGRWDYRRGIHKRLDHAFGWACHRARHARCHILGALGAMELHVCGRVSHGRDGTSSGGALYGPLFSRDGK